MDRTTFRRHLLTTAVEALNCARDLIEEPLPDPLLFRLCLNSSHDGDPLRPHQRVFPEDSDRPLAAIDRLTADQVIEELWRDGAVPEWINLIVAGETGSETIIEAECCGRFTDDDDRLYHRRFGRPPFHVLGPAFPPDYNDGDRYSIYHRVDAWSLLDLARATQRIDKIWQLRLFGPDFTDAVVKTLPVLPKMSILELWGCRVSTLSEACLKHPVLKHLRMYLRQDGNSFVLGCNASATVESLVLDGIRGSSWHPERLPSSFLRLRSIAVRSSGPLTLGSLPHTVDSIKIAAGIIDLRQPLPAHLKHLSLHISQCTEPMLQGIFQGITAVESLFLRGTPLSDSFFESIVERLRPAYIDVVDTGISETALLRVAKRHPAMRMHPNFTAGQTLSTPPAQ